MAKKLNPLAKVFVPAPSAGDSKADRKVVVPRGFGVASCDVVRCILQWLEGREVCRVGQVCKAWRGLGVDVLEGAYRRWIVALLKERPLGPFSCVVCVRPCSFGLRDGTFIVRGIPSGVCEQHLDRYRACVSGWFRNKYRCGMCGESQWRCDVAAFRVWARIKGRQRVVWIWVCLRRECFRGVDFFDERQVDELDRCVDRFGFLAFASRWRIETDRQGRRLHGGLVAWLSTHTPEFRLGNVGLCVEKDILEGSARRLL
ncbi:MAG: F-box protein [Patescibacteria group bacterium]|nr:F-box protein [Patescibacteria group bacterium]